MRPEVILAVLGGLLVLIVCLLDDWWKRRLVRRAKNQGKEVRKHVRNNRTPLPLVAAVVIALIVFVVALAHPEWGERDLGPFTPLIRWFYAKPPG
jgi:ABC-type Fe3+ transport system permease subunit